MCAKRDAISVNRSGAYEVLVCPSPAILWRFHLGGPKFQSGTGLTPSKNRKRLQTAALPSSIAPNVISIRFMVPMRVRTLEVETLHEPQDRSAELHSAVSPICNRQAPATS